MGTTTLPGIRRNGARSHLPIRLLLEMPEKLANGVLTLPIAIRGQKHNISFDLFRLLSPGVDAIEACSYVDIDQPCVQEPFVHSLYCLRMIVHGRKHIERTQDFHLLEFLIGVIEFWFVRDRADGDEIANELADERYSIEGFL